MKLGALGIVLVLCVACSAETPDASPVWPEHRWVPADSIRCPSGHDVLDDIETKLGAPAPSIAKADIDAFGGRIRSDPARLPNLSTLQSDPRALACFAGTLVERADAD